MTHLNCPKCGYLIAEMTREIDPKPVVDRTHVDDFIAACTVLDWSARTSSTDLRARYVEWCGADHVPLNPTAFGIAMRKRQIPRARTSENRMYVGLRLI
jgi:hypothetical protein